MTVDSEPLPPEPISLSDFQLRQWLVARRDEAEADAGCNPGLAPAPESPAALARRKAAARKLALELTGGQVMGRKFGSQKWGDGAEPIAKNHAFGLRDNRVAMRDVERTAGGRKKGEQEPPPPPVVLYGLLTASDVEELHRRRARFAAAGRRFSTTEPEAERGAA